MQNLSPTYHRILEDKEELTIFYDGKHKFVTLDSIVERQIRLLVESNPVDGEMPRPRAVPDAFRDGPRASALARKAAKESTPSPA
jgi:hypothetical protein